MTWMTSALWLLAGVCVAVPVCLRGEAASPWRLAAALVYTALIPLSALEDDWFGVGLASFLALVWWLNWWFGRRGKRKRRSLKAVGHKARARLAAMARKHAEARSGAAARSAGSELSGPSGGTGRIN